jgi:hypothetical protein
MKNSVDIKNLKLAKANNFYYSDILYDTNKNTGINFSEQIFLDGLSFKFPSKAISSLSKRNSIFNKRKNYNGITNSPDKMLEILAQSVKS